ncbi:acetolactate synthase large subunit [uncultured Paludibaculum sp.]|uniref:acetolactate synthase large subunit n=1 Tax=uncultured Paludibaculum sp. TaxID=1765020 RepID=UPI002AABAD45|nr:acetolactate synthase large subunit [uncultured Paludibaculum sp.]
MNGAECLLRTLLANGIDLCLMNPGTSEMQFVAALDRVPGMRGVLCLQEGVCSGAADGYARMTGRPAATLLHLGPGLANGLSNFHNARKARSPILNIVGEHSTQHLRYDAPLTADVEAFARPVSGWVRTLAFAGNMGAVAAQAIRAAYGPPGQVASLIIPADHSWSPAGAPGPAVQKPTRAVPSVDRIRTILNEPGVALLLGGSALSEQGLLAASRLGIPVFLNRNSGRIPRGAPWSPAQRVPYFPELAEALLAGIRHMILVEAEAPVSFFGYPNRRSTMAPEDCVFHTLAAQNEDGVAALEALGAGFPAPALPRPAPLKLPADGPLTPDTIGAAIAALLPENAIVSDEMVSSSEPVHLHLERAPAHDLLPVTGGSIGQGLPVAVGAALACPDRKVIALEADGSGLYTPQSLWTMAREHLDVTVVIFANRRYRILDVEMKRTGTTVIGPRADELVDLTRPDIDWRKLGESFGVESVSATSTSEFVDHLRAAMNRKGPFLIEAVLACE